MSEIRNLSDIDPTNMELTKYEVKYLQREFAHIQRFGNAKGVQEYLRASLTTGTDEQLQKISGYDIPMVSGICHNELLRREIQKEIDDERS